MLKTFTFVRARPGFDRATFYAKWCEHTRDFDLRDHPEISLNRLVLFDEGGEFLGLAENHWPNRAALDEAILFYATPAGQQHMNDLEAFMDIAHSPTMIVSHELDISTELIAELGGASIDWLQRAAIPE